MAERIETSDLTIAYEHRGAAGLAPAVPVQG
jgi:hypothetical protein